MALPLPEINGSSGVWGTILNDYLNDMDTRVVGNTSTGTANTSAVTTLTSRVNGHETAIANNTSAINGNTSAIDGIDTRLDAVESPPALAVVHDDDGADQAGFTSTTFIPGNPVVGVVFVAPPSGKVMIFWGARVQVDTLNARAHVSVTVRTGSTIGSGSTVLAASDQCSVETCQPSSTANIGLNSHLQASRHRLITGLSPGSNYNARVEHKVSVAGSGTVHYRDIDVMPI